MIETRNLRDTKGRVRKVIVDDLCPQLANGELKDDSLLFQSGFLDSMQAVDLIFMLEEEFDVCFSDAEMTPECFQSIESIAVLLLAKRGGPAIGAE
jgi:acyl carrier protein